jgi:hypothetical protein
LNEKEGEERKQKNDNKQHFVFLPGKIKMVERGREKKGK